MRRGRPRSRGRPLPPPEEVVRMDVALTPSGPRGLRRPLIAAGLALALAGAGTVAWVARSPRPPAPQSLLRAAPVTHDEPVVASGSLSQTIASLQARLAS